MCMMLFWTGKREFVCTVSSCCIRYGVKHVQNQHVISTESPSGSTGFYLSCIWTITLSCLMTQEIYHQ